MEVAVLGLEYVKVILGYSVTIPATIIIFCLLFKSRIGPALDRLLELTFPGGRATFAEVNELGLVASLARLGGPAEE